MTLIELLNSAEKCFVLAGIDSAKLDAEVLLAHALGVNRVDIYTMRGNSPPDDVAGRFLSFVQRRADGCPVAYITGVKEFWSIPLKVTGEVLIPRPESEHVVERVLEIVGDPSTHSARCALSMPKGSGQASDGFVSSDVFSILDLCTGSGNIAAALATELPNARFTLTDVSPAAVEIARLNLSFAADRSEFYCGDLFDALTIEPANHRTIERVFDLITANPPYVPTGHSNLLGKEITDYEPEISLYGGKSGLDFIAKIIENAVKFMRPGAWLVMEMGLGQAEKLELIAGECGGYDDIVISKDLAGIERVISLRRG